jgi:hypothetical protein
MSGVEHVGFRDVIGIWRIIAIRVPPVMGMRLASEVVEFGNGVSPSSECPDQPAVSRVSVQAMQCEIGHTQVCPRCPLVTAGVRW